MCEFYLLYICSKRIRQLELEKDFLAAAWEDFDPFTGDSDTDDTVTDGSDNDCRIDKTDTSPKFEAADFGGNKADKADIVNEAEETDKADEADKADKV